MKVTVNFGAVRVIVPCGDGELPVKQLMELALTRYKKATGKDGDIVVHNLKVLSDGGILDPDDKLNDVVDDREQIIATFQESGLPYFSHSGGDGTSASSVGTESPDIFQNSELIAHSMKKPFYNGSDVEITAANASSGVLPLHVRRGSEPALNQLSPLSALGGNSSKRWSAAIMVDGDCMKNFTSEGENSENDSPPGEREDGSGEEKSSPIQDKRREPLGGPVTSPKLSRNASSDSEAGDRKFEVVKLKNEDGPLGIHVVPSNDSPGKSFGLVIQGIEPGGRIDRDGRFKVGDKITEVNGLALSKESFKDALRSSDISLSCIRKTTSQLPDALSSIKSNAHSTASHNSVPTMQKRETDSSDGLTEDEKGFMVAKPRFPTPTKRALVFNKSPHSSLRKVGRRILIHLKKGHAGLGFSISSKDSSSHPLFIKTILPAGAAVEDGRLKVGDKLLEINRADVTGMTQSDVVNMLRKIPFGGSVELIVSRPESESSPSPHQPRQLPPEKAGDGVGIFPWKKRDVFTFEIPLNDTGSAGLGVSVKGKTSTSQQGAIDMGIFVKSVIHGGAASKDGRLRPNDQLLNINGISLLTMTNSQAMETLRRAMIQGEGPNANPNAITLTVARRIPSPLPDSNETGDSSCHERSDSLLSESGDSFHVSNENLLSLPTKSKGTTPDTSVSDNSGNTVIHLSKCQDSAADDSLNAEDSRLSSGVQKECQLIGESPILERLGWQQMGNEAAFTGKSDLPPNQPNWDGTQPPLTLLDVDPDKHFVFESSRNEKCLQDSFKNTTFHRKSFSSSGEMLCQSPKSTSSHRNSSQRASHRDRTKFSRNGFGRQSMPEKELYHFGADRHPGGDTTRSRPPASYSEDARRRTPVASPTERDHDDMTRDADSCTTYAKVLPNKFQRTRAARGKSVREDNSCNWSNSADSIASLRERTCTQQRVCHSPDCPYHVVPTTDHESGSSQGATSACVGPSLGMYKSSSLESLQTMVHEMRKRESSYCKEPSRVCNESFRAAVDRSYEATPTGDGTITLPDTQESDGLIQRSEAPRPHVRSATVGPTADVLSDKKNNKAAKKKGLLKGLGSMFKFGKSGKKNSSDGMNRKDDKQREQELMEARRAAEEERERIQEHYNRLVQQQKMAQNDAQIQSSQHQSSQILNGCVQSPHSQKRPKQTSATSCENGVALSPPPQSRKERMHQLRAEHQRQHQQRRGCYPRDEQEEMYERQISEAVDKRRIWQRPLPPLPHQVSSTPPPPLPIADDEGNQKELLEFDPLTSASKNYEIYKEMSKPGSRKGFVDPDRYSHYMNFQEIQQHLEQFQKGQNPSTNSKLSEIMLKFQHEVKDDQITSPKLPKQYRHTVNASRVRPVSDLFDYESLQDVQLPLKSRPKAGIRSLPRQSFTSGRQRLPIPAFMREQSLQNGGMHSGDTRYRTSVSGTVNGSESFCVKRGTTNC